MCRFASAIAIKDESVKNGFRILRNPWTDSHSDLIALHKLRDNARLCFARVEFYPDDLNDLADPTKYKLHIDEERTPEWFDDEKQRLCAESLRVSIKAMIVDGEADLLCGGVYILAKGARIGAVKNAIIVAMLGDSNVGVMRDSSNVGVMWESSNVGVMRDSSNVGVMRDSSNVGGMWESSKVGVMRGSSKVGVMRGSSNVGEMWESSNVGVMRDSSNVGGMWGSSNVGVMRGSSKVPAGKEPKT